MNSDYTTAVGNLVKFVCDNCGLVRGGSDLNVKEVITKYQQDYLLSNESVFYTSNGPASRSKVFADWILEAFGSSLWEGINTCLEIGAGNGSLVAEFRDRFPQKRFEALELNGPAAELCRRRGINTYSCPLSELQGKDFDLIYAIAVLEHTTAPTEFLKEVHNKLNPGGLLILCQPTQDVYSHDVFFVDHIYHFGTKHLANYARKCGFRELSAIVGHPSVPGFSLHLWRKLVPNQNDVEVRTESVSHCVESFLKIMDDIQRLNAELRRLRESKVKTAVFGVNELFSLLDVYSDISSFPIVCGLDDRAEKQTFERFGFPVVKPEACKEYGVETVLLTMNKAHYKYAGERISRLGLKAYEVFH